MPERGGLTTSALTIVGAWLTKGDGDHQMFLKLGLMQAAAIIASVTAIYWIGPETAGGATLLGGLVFVIVNGIGGLIWKARS